MTVVAIKDNAEVRKAVHAALAQRPTWDQFMSSLRGDIRLGAPIAHYRIKGKVQLYGNLLETARRTGWRLPVVGGETVGLIHVAKTRSGWKFEGITEGRVPERLIVAVRKAEEVLAHLPEKLELRLLDIPALRFEAVWLHSRNGTDRFIALLTDAESISEDDICSSIRKLLPLAPRRRSRKSQTPRRRPSPPPSRRRARGSS